jgi:IS605 OrfB family transposase
MPSYGCQQILIHPDKDLKAILEFICEQSKKIANQGIYYARQIYFKTGRVIQKYELEKVLKHTLTYQSLYSAVAQQTLQAVGEAFKSFIGLLRGIKKGTVTQKPEIPKYIKKEFHLVAYPKQTLKLQDNHIIFGLGKKVKAWFGIDHFKIPMPSNLNFDQIREIQFIPRNGCFYASFSYKTPTTEKADVDPQRVLGIDHGLDNWLTCVSNVDTSFIVDGRHLKSLNQWYNKRTSELKTGQPKGFRSKQLDRITEKRNRQARDAVNKAARMVLNHCIEHRIGTVVFGWNKEQKQGINIGKRNNQNFVQIPTGKLKDRISHLCEQYGIRFIETEESYTSRASFLDDDFIPQWEKKPEGWKPSGNRKKRGLYITKEGIKINADCNGAGNILRKVATTEGLDLSGVSRGALTTPSRVRIWAA